MRYVPPARLDPGRPHVAVDCYGSAPGCAVELSHWPGSATPAALKRDTSTESALAWRRTGAAGAGSAPPAVTTDHFDLDALAAVWALVAVDPTAQADALVAVATTEDFDRYVDDRSLAATLELLEHERAVARSIDRLRVADPATFTSLLVHGMLPAVRPALDGEHRHRARWEAEYEDVQESLALVDTEAVSLVEHEELDLAVVEAEVEAHPYAVHAMTPMSRVLYLGATSRPRFYYRYESFVELQSRPVAPRWPLRPLAARLDRDERAGTWVAEGMLCAHPRVQLFGPRGEVAGSSQSRDALVDRVVTYLSEAAGRGSPWSPTQGLVDHPELDVVPNGGGG